MDPIARKWQNRGVGKTSGVELHRPLSKIGDNVQFDWPTAPTALRPLHVSVDIERLGMQSRYSKRIDVGVRVRRLIM